jgi:hypothetical protein
MAINPLQLPGYATPQTIDFSPLAQLGQTFQKAQQQQKLSDLGKGLADGTIDYRTAAAQTANMGDITHTLQFLALSEQEKKRADELKASGEFNTSIGNLYGATPQPGPVTPNPMPQPGSVPVPSAGPAMAQPRAPVASSSRVWGDAEAEAAGLYEPRVGQQPVQVASAAPAQAAPASNTSTGLPGVSPKALMLIQATGNPRLPAAQRETAKTLLAAELDSGKATSDMKEWAFAKAQDPNTPDFTSWVRQNKAAGKTEVNVDTKGETALAKKLGDGLGERINEIAKEGDAARTDLAMVGQLRDLGAVIKTGGGAAAQGWLANFGIKVGPNIGPIEAYGSIVDKLTPNQRVPGSGSSSDLDVKMFKGSLPRLINTPGGNEIIENTLAGLAQYKLDRAAIADRVQTGEITAKDALKEMRALANPYENFKSFAKGGFKADPSNPASTGGAPASSAPTRQPVKVTSPAQARSLPSGTPIILPDGSPGVVP